MRAFAPYLNLAVRFVQHNLVQNCFFTTEIFKFQGDAAFINGTQGDLRKFTLGIAPTVELEKDISHRQLILIFFGSIVALLAFTLGMTMYLKPVPKGREFIMVIPETGFYTRQHFLHIFVVAFKFFANLSLIECEGKVVVIKKQDFQITVQHLTGIQILALYCMQLVACGQSITQLAP